MYDIKAFSSVMNKIVFFVLFALNLKKFAIHAIDYTNLNLIENNTSQKNEMHLLSESEFTDRFEKTNQIAIKYIWPTFPIGFLILGTIANILSIIIFTRREMRKFSSFCYFAFLNGVNLAVLYVTMVRVIMEFNFNSDIRILSIFICKGHVFLTYFLSHLSSFLLCTISVDRVISVMFLRKAKDLCTPKVAFYTTIGLVVFNFLLSSHFLIFESGYVEHDLASNITRVICEPRNGTSYSKMVQNTWKLVDMSIYAFFPFGIMLICSIIIIGRVTQQSNKFKKPFKQKENTTKGGAQAQSNLRSNNETKFNTRTRNLALMLIPVNVLFLMFMAPVVLTMYLYDNLSYDKLTLAVVELLSYCNFTFNFFIYFLTSSKFREEFYKFLNEYFCKSANNNYTNKTNATTINSTVIANRKAQQNTKNMTIEANENIELMNDDDEKKNGK